MSHLTKFIIGSCIALLVAILAVVTVYMYIQFALVTNVEALNEEEVVFGLDEKELEVSTILEEEKEVADEKSELLQEPEQESIPLKDVPLSEKQTQTLDTFGVDVETFVITSAMISCAEAKIGSKRVAEIASGSATTFSETLTLAPCLHQ